jgi:hypothetical protein
MGGVYSMHGRDETCMFYRKTGINLRSNGRIILKWISKNLNERVWNGFIWLRTGTSGGIL